MSPSDLVREGGLRTAALPDRPDPLDPVAPRRDTGRVGLHPSSRSFVGRAGPVERLRERFEATLAGQASVALIGGDGGMGKTRLLDEVCAELTGRGALVAVGACIPIEGGGLPFGPIVGVLRDIIHRLGETAATELLGDLASGWELLIAGFSPSASDDYLGRRELADELAKTRRFESILAGLARVAEQLPVAMVIEDAHWIDSASAELLHYLTRNLGESRVLTLVSYRTDDPSDDHPLPALLAQLGRHRSVSAIELTGLDRDETAALIAVILDQAPDWALVDAVWSRSQGNPLFVEELTAARHSRSLPAGLAAVIMTRVESLSKDARRVVQVAAAAGPAIDHRLLAAAAELDPEPLDAAVAEAVDQRVLDVDAEGSGYRLRHALLREAVYATILPGERMRLHHRLGGAIERDPSLGPTNPEQRTAELASHWWAAAEWARALEMSVCSADAAAAVWAFPEALVHLERALQALDRLPESHASTDRVGILAKAADVAYLARDGERAVAFGRTAVGLIDAEDEPHAAARLFTLLGRNLWGIGDSAGAFDAYRRALALLPADEASVERAKILAEEARGLMMMSRLVDAEVLCREAVAVAEAVGARAEVGHALNTLGCCRANLGYYDEGITLLRQALEIAEAEGNPNDLNRAYGNLGSVLMDSGRLEEAVGLVFDAAAVGEDLWGIKLESTTTNGSEALVRLGRFDEAWDLLAQTGQRGLGACFTSPAFERAVVAIRRGRTDQAAALLQTVEQSTACLSDVQQRGSYHLLAAEFALEQERPGDALREIDAALALTAATDDIVYLPEMCALGVRAIADQHLQDRARGLRTDVEKADLRAIALEEEAQRAAVTPVERGGQTMPRNLAQAATCAAERSRIERSDPGLWEQAADLWSSAGEPYFRAYCRLRESEARLAAPSGRAAASGALEEAWHISVDIGAEPLAEHVRQLARRARIELTDLDPIPSPALAVAADLGLTPREVEVLDQLADGRTDREIAEALFISKKTVSVHVSNILRKLDVTNRIEAGRIGQTHLR